VPPVPNTLSQIRLIKIGERLDYRNQIRFAGRIEQTGRVDERVAAFRREQAGEIFRRRRLEANCQRAVKRGSAIGGIEIVNFLICYVGVHLLPHRGNRSNHSSRSIAALPSTPP
jgi:hypothetical protein